LIVFLVITWIFFRAPSLAEAWVILTAMAGNAPWGAVGGLTTIGVTALVAMIGPNSQRLVQLLRPTIWAAAPLAGAATILLLLKMNGAPGYEFIYFHF
jgi:hypothetical protein